MVEHAEMQIPTTPMRSDEDSVATIPAETVLDSNTVYDWKIEHTGLMEKLEDRFNKEVHIPIMKQ